jgi:hypothetical protein
MYDSIEDTLKHKEKVKKYMKFAGNELIHRGIVHDNTKLESPEKEIFDEYTPKLADCTYGSEEYKTYLKEMQVALNHHYENNDHHPEYFDMRYKKRSTGKPFFKGLSGMNLFQLTEMILDWYAASQRHENGDIFKSIEQNQERFGYTDEVKMILINTINYVQSKETKK